MKILLINPHEDKILRSSIPTEVDKHTGLFPPLNLLYLASYVKASGRHEVRVLDMVTDGRRSFEKILADFKPDTVGISSVSFNLVAALEIASQIKKFNSNIRIILGGVHATLYPQESAGYPNIDFVVRGEGEKTLLALLDALAEGKGLKKIQGLSFIENGELIHTPQRPLIKDLDTLPFPDRKMVNYKKHFNILSGRFPSTTMFSGRGCSYDCSFCYHSFGYTVRLRSAKNVVDEMQEIVSLGIKDIYFVDDSFTANSKRAFEICEEILRRKLKVEWAIRGRVDSVTPEMLFLLRKAGCRRIHFGVESANPETLKRMNKRIDLEQVEKVIKWTRDADIEFGAELMLSGPGEGRDEILKTIDYSLRLNPDYAFYSLTTPYPGTRLYEEGLELGLFDSDYWGEFAANPSEEMHIRYWDEKVTEEELDAFIKKAHFRFFYRPSYILKSLFKTRSLVMLFKKVRIALGMGSFSLRRK